MQGTEKVRRYGASHEKSIRWRVCMQKRAFDEHKVLHAQKRVSEKGKVMVCITIHKRDHSGMSRDIFPMHNARE